MRERPHRLNQYLTRHVAELDDYDRQCLRWAEQLGGWVVLDTTGTGADEVAARILKLYDASLPEPGRGVSQPLAPGRRARPAVRITRQRGQ